MNSDPYPPKTTQIFLANGLHWSKLNTPVSPDSKITMANVMFMLLFDGFLFILLTGYIEAIHPGGEGVAQRPWFFVLPSYWFPGWKKNKKTSTDLQNGFHMGGNPNIEKEPPLNPTINVVNLSKTYGKSWFKKLFECKFVSFLKKNATLLKKSFLKKIL